MKKNKYKPLIILTGKVGEIENWNNKANKEKESNTIEKSNTK